MRYCSLDYAESFTSSEPDKLNFLDGPQGMSPREDEDSDDCTNLEDSINKSKNCMKDNNFYHQSNGDNLIDFTPAHENDDNISNRSHPSR